MRKLAYLSICSLVLFLTSCRKEDCKMCTQTQFNKVYGGSNVDGASSILSTSDQGYLIAGWTLSNNGNVSGNHGREDAWIVKLDCNGKIEWQKAFGGSSTDAASSVIAASDGGYIVAGLSYSNDGDISGNHGSSDILVAKLDLNGNKVWQKSYGGSSSDYLSNIVATPEGGYVMLGSTTSNDGDVIGSLGNFDAWVVKIDKNGNKLWQKVVGGIYFDSPHEITITPDGGYLLVGETYTNEQKGYDAWVVKLGSGGNQLWEKTFGGSKSDLFTSVTNTSDGKYVASGITTSNDGDVTGKHGDTQTSDAWFVKFEEGGAMVWQKTIGEAGVSYQARSIKKAPGGGYVVAGGITGNTKEVNDEALVVKLDDNGNKLRQKTFGGSLGESFFSIILNPGVGYAMSGGTYSNDRDISGNHGSEDAWVVTINDAF